MSTGNIWTGEVDGSAIAQIFGFSMLILGGFGWLADKLRQVLGCLVATVLGGLMALVAIYPLARSVGDNHGQALYSTIVSAAIWLMAVAVLYVRYRRLHRPKPKQ